MKWIIATLAVIFLLLQLTNPARTNPPVVHDFLMATVPPPDIAAMFRASCYDCHSYETKWPWYSHIAPVSWLVVDDVKNARYNMNFSDWPDDNPLRAAKRLEDMSEEIGYGEMPMKKYTFIHADARRTPAQLKEMENWLDAKAAKLKSSAAK